MAITLYVHRMTLLLRRSPCSTIVPLLFHFFSCSLVPLSRARRFSPSGVMYVALSASHPSPPAAPLTRVFAASIYLFFPFIYASLIRGTPARALLPVEVGRHRRGRPASQTLSSIPPGTVSFFVFPPFVISDSSAVALTADKRVSSAVRWALRVPVLPTHGSVQNYFNAAPTLAMLRGGAIRGRYCMHDDGGVFVECRFVS